MTQADRRVADVLEFAGGVLERAAPLLGGPAAAGVTGARSVLAVIVEAIRRRGVQTDQIVAALRKVEPLEMPWGKP